jgi:GGDEF domain-containing protein
MQLIAQQAQELTRASSGVIELAEGEEMVYAVTSGEATPYLGTKLQKRQSLSGRSVFEGRVLGSDDTAADERVDAEACHRVQAASMIGVPLSHQGETVGVLKVYAPEPHHFDAGDVETLELLSELIAAQLSHANLFETESRQSRNDALTGLSNRRAFEERLPIELARASRNGRPLALCLLDLDGFKGVNDRLGHPAVLRAVARILMGEGGIGVSVGIATGDDRDSASLLAAADKELLAAKDRLYGRP